MKTENSKLSETAGESSGQVRKIFRVAQSKMQPQSPEKSLSTDCTQEERRWIKSKKKIRENEFSKLFLEPI